MQPAAPPPRRRRRGRGDLQQTCLKSSRARASSAAKKLSGDRHRVLTMHTGTTGHFVIGGRVDIEPCQSTRVELINVLSVSEGPNTQVVSMMPRHVPDTPVVLGPVG